MGADRGSLPDRGGSPAVAYIAKCAEHGLHGERDDCFVCGEPVAMIGYVRADLHLQVHSARGRHEAEARRLRAENERLRKAVTVWVQSPQPLNNRIDAIRRVLADPEYAAQMEAYHDGRDRSAPTSDETDLPKETP